MYDKQAQKNKPKDEQAQGQTDFGMDRARLFVSFRP